jgi:diadenosine tetraphosphate (Ap4A) HIT family hydrolase
VTNLIDLTPSESGAILNLLGRIAKVLPEVDPDYPIIFMNTGKHRTQEHLHFHILPSKGALRILFTTYEKTPLRRIGTKEETKHIGDKVREILIKTEGRYR